MRLKKWFTPQYARCIMYMYTIDRYKICEWNIELNEVHWIQTSFIIFSVIALIEARGGRGGGRGGRFSSRSRSGYRSSSRTRYVSKFSGSRISSKSQLRTAILLGTVYGATRWKSRSSYRRSGECKSSIISHGSDVNFTVLFANLYIKWKIEVLF